MYADTVSSGVEIEIRDYLFENTLVQIDIDHLPNFEQFYWDPPIAMPLPDGPVDVTTSTAPVVNGQINILLDEFGEGEVYIIDILPVICGDVNSDGLGPDVSDITFLVNYLFKGGSTPPISEAADIDGSGSINISDITHYVDFLFKGGPSPVCLT